MEQAHAPQQQADASSAFHSEREGKKQPSGMSMDIMRSLSGADSGDDGGPGAP